MFSGLSVLFNFDTSRFNCKMSAALQFSAGKLMAAYGALTAAAVLPGSYHKFLIKSFQFYLFRSLNFYYFSQFYYKKLEFKQKMLTQKKKSQNKTM